jgi:hypothetical protein
MALSKHARGPAGSLSELLALPDLDFVQCAYWTVLGRGADPIGATKYVTQVRAGGSKLAVLDQLSRSAEGRAHGAQLQGLRQLLAQYRRVRWIFVGRVFAHIHGLERDTHEIRRLRALENQVAVALNKLNALADGSAFLANSSVSSQEVQRGSGTAGNSIISPSSGEGFTPQARIIFGQLRDALDSKSDF